MHKTLCGITKKFSLTKEIFREINSLVTYLVNLLLSRNFCQKCVKEISVISTLWKMWEPCWIFVRSIWRLKWKTVWRKFKWFLWQSLLDEKSGVKISWNRNFLLLFLFFLLYNFHGKMVSLENLTKMILHNLANALFNGKICDLSF